MSKLKRKDQSSLMSSCWRTSCSDPLVQYSDTKTALGGSARQPINGLRFSWRSPCNKTSNSTAFSFNSFIPLILETGFICTRSPCKKNVLEIMDSYIWIKRRVTETIWFIKNMKIEFFHIRICALLVLNTKNHITEDFSACHGIV